MRPTRGKRAVVLMFAPCVLNSGKRRSNGEAIRVADRTAIAWHGSC
jgi:hypothetical protein